MANTTENQPDTCSSTDMLGDNRYGPYSVLDGWHSLFIIIIQRSKVKVVVHSRLKNEAILDAAIPILARSVLRPFWLLP